MRVVFIEPDDGVRAAIRPLLEGYASELIELRHIGLCPRAVADHDPDVVVLSESEVAQERGRAICSMVRRSSPRLRLLLLGTTRDSARLRGLQADAFLPYPFDAAQLGHALCYLAPPSTPACRREITA